MWNIEGDKLVKEYICFDGEKNVCIRETIDINTCEDTKELLYVVK